MSHLSCVKEGWEWRNFPLSNGSHSQPSLRIFKDFPILSNPEQTIITPFFEGIFVDKNPHKCNIKTLNTNEDHLCKLPERIYNQAQIQIFESTTQNFTKFLLQNHHDLTLFETKLRKKSSRGVGKYRCLEKGALKIFRKYIQDPAKPLRWSSLLK